MRSRKQPTAPLWKRCTPKVVSGLPGWPEIVASTQGPSGRGALWVYSGSGRAHLVDLAQPSEQLPGPFPFTKDQLTTIYLDHNALSGPFPAWIADLTELQFFEITSNQLTGTLPDLSTRLTKIQIFTISENNLEGNVDGKSQPQSPSHRAPSTVRWGRATKDCSRVREKFRKFVPGNTTLLLVQAQTVREPALRSQLLQHPPRQGSQVQQPPPTQLVPRPNSLLTSTSPWLLL
ncbi:hypothetical protein M427DRAFT_260593 [Gonapodya prolifera JEL478]|uniref:L domain-like protein n=1 Tax=Gonapodya prolifera (strain JEL478) TaxID=1344416 RepID=A0A139AKS7_GONPJ|nr:hypothetical protein M427DRAFT_260593 [Gonapodya prolifera JEL478]|eukprot:KXS17402.1 hypothetical protein M427DRAFT_260593 [Gonapodya prolifera JEL478]